jgi:hypothetical protein
MADLFGWREEDEEDVHHYQLEYEDLSKAIDKMTTLETSMDHFTFRHPHFSYMSTLIVGPHSYILEFEIIKEK